MTPDIPEGKKYINPLKQVVSKWYAIYTNPRAEKLVHSRLEETGVEVFLPLQKTYRQWSDRKKLVIKPLSLIVCVCKGDSKRISACL